MKMLGASLLRRLDQHGLVRIRAAVKDVCRERAVQQRVSGDHADMAGARNSLVLLAMFFLGGGGGTSRIFFPECVHLPRHWKAPAAN